MTTTGTIIPILGAQYFANPKDVAASLTEAEKEARTFDLLTKVPRMAYYSILTLMLIREQTCEEFCIPNLPLTTDDYLSDDVIQDM